MTGVTLHDLRHLYASGLIAGGCDVVTVQRALGHARTTTTLNAYAHLSPTAKDRSRRAAGELLAEALPILADHVRTGDGSWALDLQVQPAPHVATELPRMPNDHGTRAEPMTGRS